MNTPLKSLDFAGERFYVGLDVHKKSWAVTIRCHSQHLKTFSMNPSPEELHRYLHKQYPGGEFHSVYEAGFCGFWIHRRLEQLGIHNLVVHPPDVPSTHKEKSNKRDPVDSKKLARELEAGSLLGIYIPNEPHQHLRSLCRQRQQVVRKQTRVKNQIKSLLHFNGLAIPQPHEMSPWSGAFIKWLETLKFSHAAGQETMIGYVAELQSHRQQVAEITKRLRRHSQDEKLFPVLKLLLSVPGIGFVIAMTLHTEIIAIGRFNRFDAFASFVGLVPSVSGSGEQEWDNGITSRSSSFMRYLLIEAAWVAIREDPALTLAFTELCRRMKKQEAIVRIAKKLLRRIYSVWKNQKEYVFAVVA